MVVDASHVFIAPLEEAIVKFPPITPSPWFATYGRRKNQQGVGYWATCPTKSEPTTAQV